MVVPASFLAARVMKSGVHLVRRASKAISIGLVLATLNSWFAFAANIEVTKDDKGFPYLRLSGEIVLQDAAKLSEILSGLSKKRGYVGGSLATIELEGPGGSLSAGIQIGYLLREHEVETYVRAGKVCMSACALAFIGGTTGFATGGKAPARFLDPGARLGFHGFYLSANKATADDTTSANSVDGFTLAKVWSSILISYATDMSFDRSFMGELLAKPQQTFVYVRTVKDLLKLNINLKGKVTSREPLSIQAVHACNYATAWRRYVSPYSHGRDDKAIVNPLSADEAKVIALSYIANAQPTKDTAGAGSIFATIKRALDTKDLEAISSIYDELAALGIPLIGVGNSTTFQISGWSVHGAGFYVHACIVSGTHVMLLRWGDKIVRPFQFPPDGQTDLASFDIDYRIIW